MKPANAMVVCTLPDVMVACALPVLAHDGAAVGALEPCVDYVPRLLGHSHNRCSGSTTK
jgi:hypothetical protein